LQKFHKEVEKMESKRWELSDLERLKREGGFVDFTKLNALRIAKRIWLAEKGPALQKCVEKNGKPYALLGYFLGALRIDSRVEDAEHQLKFALEEWIKPNFVLFVVLAENFCGKDYQRYQEGLPPFIAKVQYTKQLGGAIKSALSSEDSDFRKYPWLVIYNGSNKDKPMFQIGALRKKPKIDELKEAEAIEKFVELIRKYSVEASNGVKVISPGNFDKAYREAFKELIEQSKFAEQIIEEGEIFDDDELEGIEL
jgi:soluble cytochrome b562